MAWVRVHDILTIASSRLALRTADQAGVAAIPSVPATRNTTATRGAPPRT